MHTLTHTEGLLEAHALGDPYRLLMKHLHCLLNGYGWQPLFDPSDDAALDALNARLCREVFDTHCPNACRPLNACMVNISTFPEASPHD